MWTFDEQPGTPTSLGSGLPPLHQPVAERGHGSKDSRPSHYERTHSRHDVGDQVIVRAWTPEGMNIAVNHADEEAEQSAIEGVASGTPTFRGSAVVAHAALSTAPSKSIQDRLAETIHEQPAAHRRHCPTLALDLAKEHLCRSAKTASV